MPVRNVKALIQDRVLALQSFHAQVGNHIAELDLSGGVDSAVMAGLLVKALGPQNVILVHTRINTNPEQTARAQALALGLGTPLIDLDLTKIFERLHAAMIGAIQGAGFNANVVLQRENQDPTILGSIRSCIRAPIGRGFNRLMGGGIRHGTGNECEDRFIRYFQKGGDGEVDTNPIEMLSKTEVFQLAFGLKSEFPDAAAAFDAIIRATPSADLWGKGDEHTDEGELQKWLKVPFTYGRIDPETGVILSYGTIERVARLLDETTESEWATWRVEDDLFDPEQPVTDSMMEIFLEKARGNAFPASMFTDDEVIAFLKAARRAEASTRHKQNSHIPTLGYRDQMVIQGLLTDSLGS